MAIAPLTQPAFCKATVAARTATVKLDFASATLLIQPWECARQHQLATAAPIRINAQLRPAFAHLRAANRAFALGSHRVQSARLPANA